MGRRFVGSVLGAPMSYTFGGDGGLASAAKMNTTNRVAPDAVGNAHVTDVDNDRIRQITAPFQGVRTVQLNPSSH